MARPCFSYPGYCPRGTMQWVEHALAAKLCPLLQVWPFCRLAQTPELPLTVSAIYLQHVRQVLLVPLFCTHAVVRLGCLIRRLEEALALVYRTLRSPTELETTPLIAGLLQVRAPCTRFWTGHLLCGL